MVVERDAQSEMVSNLPVCVASTELTQDDRTIGLHAWVGKPWDIQADALIIPVNPEGTLSQVGSDIVLQMGEKGLCEYEEVWASMQSTRKHPHIPNSPLSRGTIFVQSAYGLLPNVRELLYVVDFSRRSRHSNGLDLVLGQVFEASAQHELHHLVLPPIGRSHDGQLIQHVTQSIVKAVGSFGDRMRGIHDISFIVPGNASIENQDLLRFVFNSSLEELA